jgi:serine phosphatase RsbU (regulator of sigma subunit)
VTGRAGDTPGAPEPEELIDRLVARVAEEQERLARVVERLPGFVAVADPTALQQAVTDIARDVCAAAVALYVDGEDHGRPPVFTADTATVTLPDVEEAPLLSAALTADEVLAVDDALALSSGAGVRAYGTVDGDRPLRCWLAAPVVAAGGDDRPVASAGRRRGTLLVGHTRPHAFGARHHRLLAAVARHLAAALDGAALVDEHVRLATGLSETLLPPLLPRIDGADVASRYRPAGESSLIGGDFYDVFPSGDGRWVAAIGDVCGGGAEAAAVTGIARYTLRAVARDQAAPGRALAVLNDAILARTVDNRFCTAVVCAVAPLGDRTDPPAIDPPPPAEGDDPPSARNQGADASVFCSERSARERSDRCDGASEEHGLRAASTAPPEAEQNGSAAEQNKLAVTWSNAGHPAPVVLRDDGTVEFLDRYLGPLLGVVPDAVYEEATLVLGGGDALVLYTDGVVEARPPDGEFFGEKGLATVLASCVGRTADGIARRLELAVIDHLGGLPQDDVAILVLRASHNGG